MYLAPANNTNIKRTMEIDQFPTFTDGDVAIVFSKSQVFRLHSGVLRRSSKLFAELLTEDNGVTLNAKPRREGKSCRWRLDLKDYESGEGRLVPVEIDPNGKTAPINTPYDNENGRVIPTAFTNWQNLFRAFYNETLIIDDTEMMSTLLGCVGLLDVAEACGSVPAISESIDFALLRHGQNLYKSIATNPLAWASLGYRIHSKTIFKDSLIHMVGKWREFGQEDIDNMDDKIRKIVERKYEVLQIKKQAIEVRMAGHYPKQVILVNVPNPGRTQYANDIYMWLSISIFRQWFAQNVCEERHRNAPDGGYTLYRQLSKGGQSYLNREQCELFHQYFPMSGRGKTAFEAHLSLYKSDIAEFAQQLMTNNSQLDRTLIADISHLVCTEVEDRDYPWIEVPEETDVPSDHAHNNRESTSSSQAMTLEKK